MKSKLRSEQGFSLVELMVVVGIIGILATLAMPRFKQFQAKAKTSEAKTLLAHMYSLQNTFFLDQNQYATLAAFGANTGSATGPCLTPANDIGFSIEPCGGPVPRYQYTAVTGAGGTQYAAFAGTGAAAFNRVCAGNAAHHYHSDSSNNLSAKAGAAPTAFAASSGGEAGIGVLCPN